MGFIIFLLRLYIWVLVIYALLSWIPWSYDTFLGRFIREISEPYLRLFSKIPLNIGMLDFTVIIAIAVLELIIRILVGL